MQMRETGTKTRLLPLGLTSLLAFATAIAGTTALAETKERDWEAILKASRSVADNPEQASDRAWEEILRPAQFGEREIIEDTQAEIIGVKAPFRAEDPAVVPVSIHTGIPQEEDLHIQRIYVYIDRNPLPLVGIFEMSPRNGRADLALRLRLDDLTYVRAIAETNDERLYMAKAFVRSTGGCSAPPPSKTMEASRKHLGKMKLGVVGEWKLGEPNLVQLRISHPNITGLAADQRTGMRPPAYFVKTLEVNYDEAPVLRSQLTFAISQDPSFRFFFVPEREGVLSVRAVDTKDLVHTSDHPLPEQRRVAGGEAG